MNNNRITLHLVAKRKCIVINHVETFGDSSRIDTISSLKILVKQMFTNPK